MAEDAKIEVSADAASRAPGALAGIPCPACSSPDLHILFEVHDRLYRSTEDEYRIVECARCRLMRLDPRPATPASLDHPGQLPEGDSLADKLERAHCRLVLRDRLRFVERAIEASEDGPVADFSPQGAVPTGVSECRAVLMLQVLEHLDTPSASIEAAYASLRPGGRLIVQSPNAGCWQFLLLGENWSGLDVPRHRINFRAADLETLLESAGFEVVRRKHFALFENPALLAMSLAPGLAPLVRRARGVVEGPTMKLMKHLLWCGLMAAVLPFTVIEAACRAGATVMIEARKKE